MFNEEDRYAILGIGAMLIFGITAIISSTIDDVLSYKRSSQKYKNRDERIKTFQKNGANLNINLNGEI